MAVSASLEVRMILMSSVVVAMSSLAFARDDRSSSGTTDHRQKLTASMLRIPLTLSASAA